AAAEGARAAVRGPAVGRRAVLWAGTPAPGLSRPRRLRAGTREPRPARHPARAPRRRAGRGAQPDAAGPPGPRAHAAGRCRARHGGAGRSLCLVGRPARLARGLRHAAARRRAHAGARAQARAGDAGAQRGPACPRRRARRPPQGALVPPQHPGAGGHRPAGPRARGRVGAHLHRDPAPGRPRRGPACGAARLARFRRRGAGRRRAPGPAGRGAALRQPGRGGRPARGAGARRARAAGRAAVVCDRRQRVDAAAAARGRGARGPRDPDRRSRPARRAADRAAAGRPGGGEHEPLRCIGLGRRGRGRDPPGRARRRRRPAARGVPRRSLRGGAAPRSRARRRRVLPRARGHAGRVRRAAATGRGHVPAGAARRGPGRARAPGGGGAEVARAMAAPPDAVPAGARVAARPPRARRWRAALRFGAAGWLLALLALDLAFPPPLPDAGGHATLVTARDGTPLRAFPDARGVWRLPAAAETVSPLYVGALLAYEDRWFRAHPGVNPAALLRAAWQAVRHGRIVSGGSTLTMQVARILEPHPRTLAGKLRQALRALQLEARLSKDEILALYLERAPFGGTIEGVEAAS